MAFGHRVPPAPMMINNTPSHEFLNSYLVIALDTHLTFRPLITSIRTKMTQKVGVMRVMGAALAERGIESFAPSTRLLSTRFVDYAAPSLISLPPSAINPTAQNTSLRTLRRMKCVTAGGGTRLSRRRASEADKGEPLSNLPATFGGSPSLGKGQPPSEPTSLPAAVRAYSNRATRQRRANTSH